MTGIDLVEWQIRIAGGERLSLEPAAALTPRGHAIECRVYAEDPDSGFLPSPGRITALRSPDGPWVRDDGGTEALSDVSIYYDPLISKLAAWGTDRAQAIARMKRALREYRVVGIRSTVPFFRWMLDQPAFRAGAFHTGSLDELLQQRQGEPFVVADEAEEDAAAIAAALHVAARVGASSNAPFESRLAPSPGLMRKQGESWKRQGRLEGLRA